MIYVAVDEENLQPCHIKSASFHHLLHFHHHHGDSMDVLVGEDKQVTQFLSLEKKKCKKSKKAPGLTARSNVNRRLLTRTLHRLNCNPIIVNNCQEVLEYLANPANPRPRMIILKVCLKLSPVQHAFTISGTYKLIVDRTNRVF